VKYNNKPTTIDGKSFRSQLEARRWCELVILQRAGDIADLQNEVTFRLDVNGRHICKYIADFVYTDSRGNLVVEDTKSTATKTPVYNLKKRLMLACHGIEIQEVFEAKRAWPKRKVRS
jgi:hypothetical protein